jgi:hypothetical protein
VHPHASWFNTNFVCIRIKGVIHFSNLSLTDPERLTTCILSLGVMLKDQVHDSHI